MKNQTRISATVASLWLLLAAILPTTSHHPPPATPGAANAAAAAAPAPATRWIVQGESAAHAAARVEAAGGRLTHELGVIRAVGAELDAAAADALRAASGLKLYAEIPPGETYEPNTYSRSNWVITDADDKPLGYFRVETSDPGHAVIPKTATVIPKTETGKTTTGKTDPKK